MRVQGFKGLRAKCSGIVIPLIISLILFTSCTGKKPFMDLSISTDSRVIDSIKKRYKDIGSMNATVNLKLSSLTLPELNAYMYYKNDGQFKLVVLMPTGMTLFSFEASYRQFTLLLQDGRRIYGNLDDIFSEFKDLTGINLPVDPGIVREVMDFYGTDSARDAVYLTEVMGDYYILNQLRSEGEISYPLRRWWINRNTMNVVKKEIFSTTPEHRGEHLFEVLYDDFRDVDNIATPFEMIVNKTKGQRMLKMSFDKVEYNR